MQLADYRYPPALSPENRPFPPGSFQSLAEAVDCLSQALESTWGKWPVFRREGGRVPVVSQLHEILGIESVLTGFGLPDDNLHAPNEKLHLPTFYRGIEAFIRFFS